MYIDWFVRSFLVFCICKSTHFEFRKTCPRLEKCFLSSFLARSNSRRSAAIELFVNSVIRSWANPQNLTIRVHSFIDVITRVITILEVEFRAQYIKPPDTGQITVWSVLEPVNEIFGVKWKVWGRGWRYLVISSNKVTWGTYPRISIAHVPSSDPGPNQPDNPTFTVMGGRLSSKHQNLGRLISAR